MLLHREHLIHHHLHNRVIAVDDEIHDAVQDEVRSQLGEPGSTLKSS